MAINIGSPDDLDEPALMIEINTTPLIDVMLVLLVMLIITIPIQLHSVTLQMPVAVAPGSWLQPEKIQIDIDDKSNVYWQGLLVSPTELEQKMKSIVKFSVQPEVQIRANGKSRYAVFVNVLAKSRLVGLNKIAVVSARQLAQ